MSAENIVPPAVAEFAVEERQQLLDRIDEQAREIADLRHRCGMYGLELTNEVERRLQAQRELADLKAQPSGVVLPGRKFVEPLDFNQTNSDVLAIGWNDCLDEVARINSANTATNSQFKCEHAACQSLGEHHPFCEYVKRISAGDERGHDTKGSRKALGTINAKLRAKVGKLEREISGLKGQHSETDYREGFESWGRREGVALWPNPKSPETYYCGSAQKAAEAFKAGAEWQARAALTASAPNRVEDALGMVANHGEQVLVPRKALADFIEYGVPGDYDCDEQWFADRKVLVECLHPAAPSAGSQTEQGE